MSEVTCSDPREFCSYRKDYSLSAEDRDGCAIPQDPYTPTSKVTDTLESGGNSICWYDMDSGYAGHEWEEFYSGDAACFCNTNLCNTSWVQNPSLLFVSFLLLLQAGYHIVGQ